MVGLCQQSDTKTTGRYLCPIHRDNEITGEAMDMVREDSKQGRVSTTHSPVKSSLIVRLLQNNPKFFFGQHFF